MVERWAHRPTMHVSTAGGSLHALLFAGAAGTLLLLMPSILAAYPLFILCHMLVLSIACLALNLLFGTAGTLSLGHATYFGVAAYTGAFLYRFSGVGSLELFCPPACFPRPCSPPLSDSFASGTRIFFAILTLRPRWCVFPRHQRGGLSAVRRGGWGLYMLGGGSMSLPRFTILGTEFSARDFVPVFYNVIVAAFLVSMLLLWRITYSPFRLALRAIRDNDTRAAFIGIPVRQYRWYAFIVSGILHGSRRRPVRPIGASNHPRPTLLAILCAIGSRHRPRWHATLRGTGRGSVRIRRSR